MALSGDLTTFDLQFGAYTDAVGLAALVAAGGKLFAVDPSTNKKIRLTHITSGQVIVPDPVDVTISEDGTGVVTGIPHTGQATISPVGYAWRVEWNIASNKPSPGNLTFVVDSGATADFDLLVPAETVPAVAISQPSVSVVGGVAGNTTAQQLVDALAAPLGAYATDAELATGLAAKQDAATLADDTAEHVADGSALDVALRAALGAGPQGLYASSNPRPLASQTIRVLAKDPNHNGANGTGRIWAHSNGTQELVYSDNDGTTATSTGAAPWTAVGHFINQLLFSSSFLWAVCSPNAGAAGGQVWRSPLPGADGTGISWTKVWDGTGQALGPAGAAASVTANVYMRNASLAVDATTGAAYLLEYGGTITGGPSLWYAANASAATPGDVLWVKAKTWARARHGHAVKIINGVLHVSLGDLGFFDLTDPDTENIDVGLWTCSTMNPATGTWTQRSNYGTEMNGNKLQIINFEAVTLDTKQQLICESDQRQGHGPILYPRADGTGAGAFVPLCILPPPYVGTMRQLTIDPATKNAYWVVTGEAGAIGPYDSIWGAPAPYTKPYLLEAFALGSLGTTGDPVISNGYFWAGTFRCVAERFYDEETV